MLGPVTYIVLIDEGQSWKRHGKFVNHSTTESAVESRDSNSKVGFDPDESLVDTSIEVDAPPVPSDSLHPIIVRQLNNLRPHLILRMFPHLPKQWDVVTPLVTVILLTIIRTNVKWNLLNLMHATVLLMCSYVYVC